MKRLLLISLCAFGLIAVFTSGNAVAQTGNIDWETLWVVTPPPLQPDTVYNYFMRNARQYTGLAYDRWRDVIYITSPQQCVSGTIWWNCPRIFVWDANTGTPAYSIGRSADGNKIGMGGELPVPLDTIVPSIRQYGYSLGKYCIYKVDMDDEGRIFVCDLVNPLWGVCIDLNGDGFCGLPQQEEENLKTQGPFRVWRWDTPKSTPLLAYATLNPSASSIGNIASSEMNRQRDGDAFDVIGMRGIYDDPVNGPTLLDSTRMYTAGGSHYVETGEVEGNTWVEMIIPDHRPAANRPKGEKGTPLTHRLGTEHENTNIGIGSHGIAATSMEDFGELWLGSSWRVVASALQVYYNAKPTPQSYKWDLTGYRSLTTSLTGNAGPLKFFYLKQYGRKFLLCCDSKPTDVYGSNPNNNTSVRLLDVTTAGGDSIVFSPTPQLGNKNLANISNTFNFCSAVDYKFDTDDMGMHLVVFVLMANNGIGCYRTRRVFPVELTTFKGVLNNERIDLSWNITAEKNNYGFEVMRSFNGGTNWERAGFVPGRGTTTTPHEYTFVDPLTATHKSVGSVQYRLRQLDTDGAVTTSPVVTVYIGTTPSTIELSQNYSNPFSTSTQIAYQLSKPGFVSLRVFNAVGEEVRTLVNDSRDAGTYQVQMTADNLPAGTYMYQLNVDGKTMQKKMVITK